MSCSCRIAAAGGETSLSHGNVVYRPKTQGDLLIFGLKQDNERMDAQGRTEHVGCPVRKGEKSIVTLRLAEGDGPEPTPDIEASLAEHDFFATPVPGKPLRMLKGSDLLLRQQQRQQHAGEAVAKGRAKLEL